jgi:hypothetical protein
LLPRMNLKWRFGAHGTNNSVFLSNIIFLSFKKKKIHPMNVQKSCSNTLYFELHKNWTSRSEYVYFQIYQFYQILLFLCISQYNEFCNTILSRFIFIIFKT